MKIYLEHANITVPDLDEAITFLTTVDPEFKVRHGARSDGKYEWAHVGNDDAYIALQSLYPGAEQGRQQFFIEISGLTI